MGKNGTSFAKGDGRPRKQRGDVNKITKTVKEVVLAAFNELQSDPKANMVTWGKANPRDFYNVAAKLIPTEVAVTMNKVGKDLEDEKYE